MLTLQQRQQQLMASVWSWVMFPFNLWLWTVTIPLRIFLYVTFGDFWKWSKNGELPKQVQNGRVVSFTETRVYSLSKPQETPKRKLSVGSSSQTERYPTYISSELFSEDLTKADESRRETTPFTEKAPSFFTVEKSEVKQSRKESPTKQEKPLSTISSGLPMEERPIISSFSQESRQESESKANGENAQIHSFFLVENQVNDVPIKKESTSDTTEIPLTKNQKKSARKSASKKAQQKETSSKTETQSTETQSTETQSTETQSTETQSTTASSSVESQTESKQVESEDKEKIIQELHQQITDLEEREKQMLHEKLEIESKFENESAHWKEDNESSQKDKLRLREIATQNEKKCFDLQQQICSLRSQLHAHGDFKLDQSKDIKSVWHVAHHEQDYTKMVEKQQYVETHQKTYIEAAADRITHPQNQSVGAN